jgi:hypothetical protein
MVTGVINSINSELIAGSITLPGTDWQTLPP